MAVSWAAFAFAEFEICHGRITLIADGSLLWASLRDGLASSLDRLVLVPNNWLAALPRRQTTQRGRHAVRLA